MALPSTARRRIRIRLRGIVQGVGFRPFVHNLARELRLGGYVSNSSAGLVAEVEGDPAALDRFVRTVTHEPPPLAWVQETEIAEMEALGEDAFAIHQSVAVAGEFALVSPDVATCEACFGDFTRPADRRYGYPFTNCTNCGPRYTIVQDIPYDRAQDHHVRIPHVRGVPRGIRGPGRPALSRPAECVSRVRAAALGLFAGKRFNRRRPLGYGRGSERGAGQPLPRKV